MICTHRINPACGVPRSLSRFARRAGLVHRRQTFVLRCHGDDGWPLRAEASSNLLFVVQLGGTREIILYRSRLRSREAMGMEAADPILKIKIAPVFEFWRSRL